MCVKHNGIKTQIIMKPIIYVTMTHLKKIVINTDIAFIIEFFCFLKPNIAVQGCLISCYNKC